MKVDGQNRELQLSKLKTSSNTGLHLLYGE